MNVLDSFDPSRYILGYGKTPFVGCWSVTENISLNLDNQTTDSGEKRGFLIFFDRTQLPKYGSREGKNTDSKLAVCAAFYGNAKGGGELNGEKITPTSLSRILRCKKKTPWDSMGGLLSRLEKS